MEPTPLKDLDSGFNVVLFKNEVKLLLILPPPASKFNNIANASQM